ncbi:MAG: F0F1 ATP synthase subunit delta, partial [Angustibacter sp.]
GLLMQGSSRESLAAAQGRLSTRLGAAGTDGAAIGEARFAVIDVLDTNPSLRRALTDPSYDADAKAALVRRLLEGKASADVVELVSDLARSRWSSGRDLADAAEELAAESVLASAENAGRADRVEDELFRFERLIDADPAVARSLADRAAPAASKATLVSDLIGGKAAPETVTLVQRAVASGRGLGLAGALERYIELAARRREQLVAHVKVALPLEAGQRDRLAAALKDLYGKAVHLNVDVDPDVLGGIRIEIGDEVLDGTVSRRLDDVRRRLAG